MLAHFLKDKKEHSTWIRVYDRKKRKENKWKKIDLWKKE